MVSRRSIDGLTEPAGEVRRGKLSGDLGGDTFTAGVYGVMIQHAKYPVGYGEFKTLRDTAAPSFAHGVCWGALAG